MANKTVEAFVKEAKENAALKEKLESFHAIAEEKNYSMEESVRLLVVPVAKEFGFKFSAEDYISYVKKKAENRALGDDELGVVFGGMNDVVVGGAEGDVTVVDQSININTYYNFVFVFPPAQNKNG